MTHLPWDCLIEHVKTEGHGISFEEAPPAEAMHIEEYMHTFLPKMMGQAQDGFREAALNIPALPPISESYLEELHQMELDTLKMCYSILESDMNRQKGFAS